MWGCEPSFLIEARCKRTLNLSIYCKDGHQGDKNLSQWQLDPTATGGQAKLSGTELCLDSGDTSNGIDMAVTTCSDSISQKFTFNQKTQIQANNQSTCARLLSAWEIRLTSSDVY